MTSTGSMVQNKNIQHQKHAISKNKTKYFNMDIESQKETSILLNQEFDSFEELTDIVTQWDLDYRQLNAEQFNPMIFQAQTGSILVSRVRFGCHVEQRGATPPGMRTFSVLDADCPELYWFGHSVNKDDLLVFPAHGEAEAFTRAGFGVTAISIPEDLLEEYFEQNGIDNLSNIIGPEEIVKKTSNANLNELRYLVHQLKALLLKTIPNQFISSGIQSQILLSIFNIMTDNNSQLKNSLLMPSRQKSLYTLRTIVEYINTNNNESLRIDELCRMVGISNRTLQYLFKNELGLTPKAYLKGCDLYQVHRDLRNCQQSNIKIMSIANKYGFWHMGQFAADYYKLFRELPSETLKRSV